MLVIRNNLFVPGGTMFREFASLLRSWCMVPEPFQAGLDPRIAYDIGISDRNPDLERKSRSLAANPLSSRESMFLRQI